MEATKYLPVKTRMPAKNEGSDLKLLDSTHIPMSGEEFDQRVPFRKQWVRSTTSYEFFNVKLLIMMVYILLGVPVAAAFCFRLLLPLFTVDMPRRHVEPESFV